MNIKLFYGVVRESDRKVIFVLRAQGRNLGMREISLLDEKMRDYMAHRGELSADLVIFQGTSRETMRFYGSSYSVTKVRTAMFNAAVSWTPITLA